MSEIYAGSKDAKHASERLIEALEHCENAWKSVAEKQLILHHLFAEQMIVSDKFTSYYEVWRDRDYSASENIATFHQFTEIDEQVHLLSRLFEEFEGKLFQTGKLARELIRDLRVYMDELRKNLEDVVKATSIEDVRKVDLSRLDWIHSIPDLTVPSLAEEWEQLQLEPRITELHRQLEILVQVGGGNV